MDKSIFSFELVDKYTPEVVIKNILREVEEATQGHVIGNVEDYDGHIRSYIKKTGLAASLGSIQRASETIEVDIQDDLGEQDKAKHRYEVFLTVKGLEHYKYRMMFVDYGTVSYPVMIVMNKELAIEYSGKRNEAYSINSMKDLEDMINKVMSSDTMVSLIQSLINESLRQEVNGVAILATEDIPDEN